MKYLITLSALLTLWCCGCAHVRLGSGDADSADAPDRNTPGLHKVLRSPADESSTDRRETEAAVDAGEPTGEGFTSQESSGKYIRHRKSQRRAPPRVGASLPSVPTGSVSGAAPQTPVITGNDADHHSGQWQPVFYLYIGFGVLLAVLLTLLISGALRRHPHTDAHAPR